MHNSPVLKQMLRGQDRQHENSENWQRYDPETDHIHADKTPPEIGQSAYNGREEHGSNDRAERTATLSYIHGPRPGIYGFVAGRVVSIERAPEPPAPPKPAKPAKPAKSAKPKPKPTTT